MRFSCASTESVVPGTVKTSKRAPRNAPALKKRAAAPRKRADERMRMKTRSDSRMARLEQAAMALKKKGKKAEVAQRAPDAHVYVGNLQGGITEDMLHHIFSKCGRVTRVQIRCSGGQAVTVGAKIPKEIQGPRDRQYATVEFAHISAVRLALTYNGRSLNKVPLVVSVSAVDLPEMKDIIDNRINRIDSRDEPKAARPTTRPLQSEPTELCIVDGPTPRPHDKFRIMGYSFAPTVI